MKLLLYLSKYSLRLIIVASLSALLSGLSSAGLIALIQKLLHGQEPLSLWIQTYAFLLVMNIGLTYLSIRVSTSLIQKVTYFLRTSLMTQFLSTSFQVTERKKSDLFTALTTDISHLTDGIKNIPGCVTGFGMLIGCLVYLSLVSWQLVCSLSIVLILAFFFVLIPRKIAYNHSKKVQSFWNQLFQSFQDMTSGNKELLLNRNRAHYFLNQEVEPLLRNHQQAAATERVFQEFLTKIVDFFLLAVLGLAVATLVHSPHISTQQLSIFLTTLLFAIKPISSITSFFSCLQKVNVAIDHIHDIGLNLAQDERISTSGLPFDSTQDTLKIADTTFQYLSTEDHPFHFGPVSAEFNPGQITFIIGGNGSGKSTLGKLLCGLYLPELGAISIGKTPLTPQTQFEFHQYFSAIFSDFHLFKSIVEEKDKNTLQQAQHYLEKLDLAHKVKIKKHHFSTTSLSQGQRKRLALVNAFLEDRDCYIFDEWAADQDPEFKKVFYHDILPELKKKGKIVIAITHDDAYFSCADQLIFLENGKIRLS